MYKDVWKKFGAKTLLVLCSVLLLGGVAIAAPRLRAVNANGKYVLEGPSTNPDEVIVSDDLTAVGNLVYDDGNQVVPTGFQFTKDGKTITLTADDVNIKITNGTEVGQATAELTAKPSSIILDTSLVDDSGQQRPGKCTVSYDIAPKNVSDDDITYTLNGPVIDNTQTITVSSLPYTVSASDFTLQYGSKVLTEGVDYTFDTSANQFNALSLKGTKQPFAVKLKNYTIGSSRSDTKKMEATVVKSVNQLQVFLDTVPADQYVPKPTDSASYRPALKVEDSAGNVLDENTHYTATPGRDKNGPYYELKGKLPYYETRKVYYKVNTKGFNPVCTEYNTPIDYDGNGGSYIVEPMSVFNQDESMKLLTKGVDYKIGDSVDDNDPSDNYHLEGAANGETAGTVTVDVVGLGDYEGATGTLTYYVQRNLANIDAIDISLAKDENHNGDCLYNNGKHFRKPVITFKNASNYTLEEGTDYELSYSLDPDVKTLIPVQGDDNVKYAGDVSITVKGKAKKGEGGGGYYGELIGGDFDSSDKFASVLQYEIGQRPVGTDFDLINTHKGPYNLEYKNPHVDNDLRIRMKNEQTGEFNRIQLSETYGVTYTDPDGNVMKESDWAKAKSGTYTITLSFNGNLVGDLSTTFEMVLINPNQVNVSIGGKCQEDDATGDTSHVYTGAPHTPTVTATYGGNPLDGYEVWYSRDRVNYSKDPADHNVDAGRVYVRIVLSGNVTVDKDDACFDIEPRPLSDGTVRLSATDGFTGSNPVKHDYTGRYKAPDLTEMALEITNASGTKSIPIQSGDFTRVNERSLFTESGGTYTPVSLDNVIGEKQQYHMQISGKNNFINDKADAAKPIYTEAFQFNKRSLNKGHNDGEITWEIDPVDYDDTWDEAKYRDHIIDNLVVKDALFKDASGAPTRLRNEKDAHPDYYITDVSKDITNTGTVTFVIRGARDNDGNEKDGCYSSSIQSCALNVGRDIATAQVSEKTSSTYRPFTANRTLQIAGTYSEQGTGSDKYGLSFSSGNNDQSHFTLSQSGSSTSIIPFHGDSDPAGTGKYRVDGYGNVDTSTNPSTCTVTLQGINGYYGRVVITFNVEKTPLGTGYTVYFPDGKGTGHNEFQYTGADIHPDIRIYATADIDTTTGEPLPNAVALDPSSYEIVGYGGREQDVNEQYTEAYKTERWGEVKLEGRLGFEGGLSGYFRIMRRDISNNTGGSNTGDNVAGANFLMTGWSRALTYRLKTLVTKMEKGQDQEVEGTWQDITLFFDPDKRPTIQSTELRKGEDYLFTCTNCLGVGKGTMTLTGINNYTGTVTMEYDILKASLNKDCEAYIVIGDEWLPFTGSPAEPRVVVTQKISDDPNNTNITTLTKDKDYKLEYVNPTFVSKTSTGSSTTNGTLVKILPADGNGNYMENDPKELSYKIYGNINPNPDTNAGAYENSRLVINDGNPVVIDYAKTINYNGLHLVLQQKADGGSYNAQDGASNYPMVWPDDYTARCIDETIGYRTVTVKGVADRNNQESITGERRIGFYLRDNINNADKDLLWSQNGSNGNKVNIVSGSALTNDELGNLLYIECGGRKLSYGTDYQLVGNVKTELGGPYTIDVEPTEAANKAQIVDASGNVTLGEKDSGYLLGTLTVEYYVTSDLSGKITVPGLKDEPYIYAHGNNVFDPRNDDFGVVIGGKPLVNGKDYTVTILRDGQPAEPKECGTYQFRLEGSGSYSGGVTKTFTIAPYDLGADYAQGNVNVSLKNDTVTFTGQPVHPDVDTVTITGGRSTYTLKEVDTSTGLGDYQVSLGSGEHTNWTDTAHGVTAPKMLIEGKGNYTGSVSKDYTIRQKDISDADVVEDRDIFAELFYKNGEEIKPVPILRYMDGDTIRMVLRGIEYAEADASRYDEWTDTGTHFMYRFLDDVTSVSGDEDHRIRVRGLGNFTGTREIKYRVEPLPLSKTRLTFLSEETPVYDSGEQKPAFQLTVDGLADPILTYMNGRVTSKFLKPENVDVDFANNINATSDDSKAEVKVSITGNVDNYTGETEQTFFSILPASLTDHVSFMYHPKGEMGNVNLSRYKLNLPWVDINTPVRPDLARKILSDADLQEGQLGIFFNFPSKANHGAFLEEELQRPNEEGLTTGDYTITYTYVEPDSEDVEVKEGFGNEETTMAGKVKVTLTGVHNYTDSASFWYYIGEDISAVGSVRLQTDTTMFNGKSQVPVEIVSGLDVSKYSVIRYRGEVKPENMIPDEDAKKDFINAGTYYVRIEGAPANGTYATQPYTLTYTITPRPLSSTVVIDGFKKEYSYTGSPICPIGISVTDNIDNVKYRLTENVDYTLTYTNNINAGTAMVNVAGQNNFRGTATARFTITSSTISSGGSNGSGGSLNTGSGELSGNVAVAPDDVRLTMDTSEGMYYTGKQLYPAVSIAGMTENVDYTVTYSNNINVGTGTITITGIRNSSGTITKNFAIIARLSDCKVSEIPDQEYTGYDVTPPVTVMCGNIILAQGTDYTVTYANNREIGTATVMIRAGNNSRFTGSTTATFSIGNNIGGFIISGYSSSYPYTGSAITPGVVVESGNTTLRPGTDYTVAYENNVNAGLAAITVTGIGRYAGTQTVNFVIEPKNIQICDVTEVEDKTYTGDTYTPSVTVSDGNKELVNGVDYTVTYTNNTNPGLATIMIQGLSNNYIGTKIINFNIGGVAVSGLRAANVKYSSIRLRWAKQGYADGYQVCDAQSKVVKNVKTNSAQIKGLKAGRNYKYKVRSYILNADGSRAYGSFSPVITATTKLKTPSVKLASIGSGQARISWSKVSGASGYEIYYKSRKGAKYRKLKTINDPSIRICTVRGMSRGDKCYIRVRAFKKNGSKKIYSASSSGRSVTVR